MRITFLHPDLGIGGAERLVVDAAMAAKGRGHEVKIVTNQYSVDYCFAETKDIEIKVINYFPRNFFGVCTALCAYIRMCIAALYVCWCRDADLIFSDQISASQAILRVLSPARLVFYCHFPDQLLTQRRSMLKRFYRFFLDSLEQWSTGLAHVICVNSQFTAGVFRDTFPKLHGKELHVLYPTINTEAFDHSPRVDIDFLDADCSFLFVSLNRFERKKNLALAIKAFACLKDRISAEKYAKCRLVIAGGYDKLNRENIEHFAEMEKLAMDNNLLPNQLTLLKSPGNVCKIELLRRALAVIYTPNEEHFGIVPLEAMYCGTPVMAINSGGPKETIVNGITGFLLPSEPSAFADAMTKLIEDDTLSEKMGRAGRKRVMGLYNFDSFSQSLDDVLKVAMDQ